MSKESIKKIVVRMLRMYDIRAANHTVDQTLRMHPEKSFAIHLKNSIYKFSMHFY